MSDSYTTEIYILLHDGKPASKSLYDTVRLLVEEVIPGMVPGVGYTTEILCGEDFWVSLKDDNERRMAGKCMANLVKIGKLQLKIQGCEHKFPRKYMKI